MPFKESYLSRGLGKRERDILARMTDKPMALWGTTRSERVAYRRAARSLEQRGLVDVFVLWNDVRTHGVVYVVRAGAVNELGQPWKSLSVACAPNSAQATLKRLRLNGSLRSIAEQEGVSVTTVRRDLRAVETKRCAITD